MRAAQEKYDELQARYFDLEERLALEQEKSKAAPRGRSGRGRGGRPSKSKVVPESGAVAEVAAGVEARYAELEASHAELQARYAAREERLAEALDELSQFKAEVEVAELMDRLPAVRAQHSPDSELYLQLLTRLRQLTQRYPATLVNRPEIRIFLRSRPLALLSPWWSRARDGVRRGRL